MIKSTPTRGTRESALVERVPRLSWGSGQDCTFAGALSAAMTVTDHPYSYAELIALRRDVTDIAHWSAKARHVETEVLAEVYQFEAQAIAHIEMALSSMEAEKGDGTMILESVDSYRVVEPMFESVRVVLAYRGKAYSSAYVQGISGAAFRMGGICPCAPTCACAMGTQDLLKTLGYEVEHLSLCEEGMDLSVERKTCTMPELSEPRIIERDPYLIVGAYATFEGDDEGPGWSGASKAFYARREEITNRVDDAVLGFLYRPHQDHPDTPESVRACFVGVEVADLDHVPKGLSTTQFSGGKYVIVACKGDTENEAAMGVGEGVGFLGNWIAEHGYTEGDACFALSHEDAPKPPFVEYVYIKIEE